MIQKIAILNEAGLSLNGLEPMLKLMFPRAEVVNIPSHYLSVWGLQEIDMLVLPGNNSENSHYPTLLTAPRQEVIHRKIKNDGMVLMTFCAASYLLMDDISYTTREKETKIARGLGWIKGQAFQAFSHITRTNIGPHLLANDYVEAKLSTPLLPAGNLMCLNVNGPAFEFYGDEKSLCQVFLSYADVGNSPAAFTKKIGKGVIIALGVHPELSQQNSSYSDNNAWIFRDHERDRFQVINTIARQIDYAPDY